MAIVLLNYATRQLECGFCSHEVGMPAPSSKGQGINFHCQPVVSEVHDQFGQPRAPLVFITFARVDFLKETSDFSACYAPERRLIESSSELRAFTYEESEDFFWTFVSKLLLLVLRELH